MFRRGPHVFHGGFSTFLAVVVFANAYFAYLLTFFKVMMLCRDNDDLLSQLMVLLVSTGLFHALVALPTLLVVLGPPARV